MAERGGRGGGSRGGRGGERDGHSRTNTGRGRGGTSSRGRGGGGQSSAGGSRGSSHYHGSGTHGRPRRAADYTPAVEPRADQATIGEAARRAAEAADREQAEAEAELTRLRLSDNNNHDEDGPAGTESNEHLEPDLDEEPQEIQHTCYICAEPVKYFMLGTCSHRTCHICTTRLRSLYKKKECTFCKTELATVICTGTRDAEVAYENFPPDAFPYSDHKLGIAFQTDEMMQDVLALLRFNCPQINCDYLGTGWADLKKHARTEHGLVFCDLCTKYKKIFAHEHSLFTPHGLTVHSKEGDPPDAAEHTGFTGHPNCEFCKTVFYDNDQLFAHCRDRHEQCFICIRNGTGRYQYYVDYAHLETHFQSEHYLCLSPQCLEERFVVFDSEIDLQAHQLEKHGAAATGGKASRMLETNFTYASTSRDPRAGGGVSMQPRKRPQQHEQTAVPSAGGPSAVPILSMPEPTIAGPSNGIIGSRGRVVPGLNRAGFNTSLSSDAPPSSPAGGKKGKKPIRDEGNMGETITGVQQTDPVMAARHASLLTRVSEAVNGSESKLASYRAAVRAFRNNETSATDTIKTIHSILENQTDVTARVVTSTADLLDKPDKVNDLHSAWHDYQISIMQSTDFFPSLVPTAPARSGQAVSMMGAPSSRSLAAPNVRQIGGIVSRSQKQGNAAVWARVEDAAANRNVGAVPGLTQRLAPRKDGFPTLPVQKNKPSAVSSRGAVRGITAWASTTPKATSPSSVYYPRASAASSSLLSQAGTNGSHSIASSANNSRPSTPSTGDFPSLPPMTNTAKARAQQKAALFGGKNNGATASSNLATNAAPWSPPVTPPVEEDYLNTPVASAALPSTQQQQQPQAKKKKGKTVLLHYGL